MIPHQLGPHAQSRFLGLRPSCSIQPHPALNPISPSVWNPTLEVQTTDKSSHAKWEFNCKQFLWIMGPSVPPYAKGKKKIPIKKKILPAPHPKLTPNGVVAKVLVAGAKHRAGMHPGGFLLSGPGKVRELVGGQGGLLIITQFASANCQRFESPGVFHSSGPLHMPCSYPRTHCPFTATSLMLFGWSLQQDLSWSAALPHIDGDVGKSGVVGPTDEGYPLLFPAHQDGAVQALQIPFLWVVWASCQPGWYLNPPLVGSALLWPSEGGCFHIGLKWAGWSSGRSERTHL